MAIEKNLPATPPSRPLACTTFRAPLGALSRRLTSLAALAPQRTRLHAIVLLGAATLFAGCGNGAADKLEGKWVGDRIDNVSADQVARATAWVKATTLEFAGDKLTVTIPTEQPRKGSFKVAKVDGDKLLLSVQRKDTQTRDETALTLEGHKTLHWDIGEGREITLIRAQ
jgi:hypothetical protein